MATVSGTLVNDVKSSYGSPYVHYSCTYVSTRADTSSSAVSVALSFKAWLHSSASFLGTGISLIIYARLDGGSWQSVTIKSSSASWSGNSTKHSAPTLTVTGSSTGGKINVEFYVARGDSGGNAGKLDRRRTARSCQSMAAVAAVLRVCFAAAGTTSAAHIKRLRDTRKLMEHGWKPCRESRFPAHGKKG